MRPRGPSIVLTLMFASLYSRPVISHSGNANFVSLCQEVKHELILSNPSLASVSTLDCRTTYEPGKPPAEPIIIPVSECMERCPSYELSNIKSLSQWVGPFVGFLLPALAFVISIPRPDRLPRGEKWYGARKLIGFPWLVIALVIMLIDIVFWIVTVFAFSGPLVAGAIHEAFIDHYILNYAQSVRRSDPDAALLAITFSLVGSLEPEKGDLAAMVLRHITDSRHGKKKLSTLLSLLPSYGARVGIPILFYLGAYGYALFDASSKRGDNDTAHAVAFGLWYGVVVIVAIVATSVLGVDNPASLEAIFCENDPVSPSIGSPTRYQVGRTDSVISMRSIGVTEQTFDFHTSTYRTVWLWKRARVFQEWNNQRLPLAPKLASKLRSPILKIISGILASVLIALPCAGACWISYSTPLVGFGCRSVTHLIYAASQILLIFIFWLYYNSYSRLKAPSPRKANLNDLSALVYGVSGLAVLTALLCSIGGTIMQLVGVFRNCICKAGLKYILYTFRPTGRVNLANDTKDHRDNAKWWIVMGSIGIGYIGFLSVLGWMYQARSRGRCRSIIGTGNGHRLIAAA